MPSKDTHSYWEKRGLNRLTKNFPSVAVKFCVLFDAFFIITAFQETGQFRFLYSFVLISMSLFCDMLEFNWMQTCVFSDIKDISGSFVNFILLPATTCM